MLLMEGNAQGTIDARENEMIQNIFDFDDMDAEQICTHRIDVDALYLEDDMAEWEVRKSRVVFTDIYDGEIQDAVMDNSERYPVKAGKLDKKLVGK